MEFLGNDGHLIQSEYNIGPYHGIQGPKSGVVQKNTFFRYSPLDQVPFKNNGFVIIPAAVVAADQDIIYFSRLKKSDGRIYPIGVIWIGPAPDQSVRSP